MTPRSSDFADAPGDRQLQHSRRRTKPAVISAARAIAICRQGAYLQFARLPANTFLKAGAGLARKSAGVSDFDGTYSAKTAGIVRANEAATTSLKNLAAARPAIGALAIRPWKDGKGGTDRSH